MATSGVNETGASRGLRPGMYVPVPTFFLPGSEDLDIPTFERHIVRIARAGTNPVLSGSTGEAPLLSHAERAALIRSARAVLDAAGLTQVPIISGIAAGATREAIEFAYEAAEAGADAVIAIINGYFAGALANDRRALKAYWTEIAEKSPLPVLVYNYPAAAGGIDLDSDLITELAIACPNLAGVKLTCGNVGKLTRICHTVSDPLFAKLHPRKNPAFPFLVFGGYSDFLVASSFVNAHGAITGLANLAPKSAAKLYDLTQCAIATLKSPVHPPPLPSDIPPPPASIGNTTNPYHTLQSAQHMQGIIGRADATIAKYGVAGIKYLLKRLYGYGGAPRRPLFPLDDPLEQRVLWEHPDVKDLVKMERELGGEGFIIE